MRLSEVWTSSCVALATVEMGSLVNFNVNLNLDVNQVCTSIGRNTARLFSWTNRQIAMRSINRGVLSHYQSVHNVAIKGPDMEALIYCDGLNLEEKAYLATRAKILSCSTSLNVYEQLERIPTHDGVDEILKKVNEIAILGSSAAEIYPLKSIEEIAALCAKRTWSLPQNPICKSCFEAGRSVTLTAERKFLLNYYRIKDIAANGEENRNPAVPSVIFEAMAWLSSFNEVDESGHSSLEEVDERVVFEAETSCEFCSTDKNDIKHMSILSCAATLSWWAREMTDMGLAVEESWLPQKQREIKSESLVLMACDLSTYINTAMAVAFIKKIYRKNNQKLRNLRGVSPKSLARRDLICRLQYRWREAKDAYSSTDTENCAMEDDIGDNLDAVALLDNISQSIAIGDTVAFSLEKHGAKVTERKDTNLSRESTANCFGNMIEQKLVPKIRRKLTEYQVLRFKDGIMIVNPEENKVTVYPDESMWFREVNSAVQQPCKTMSNGEEAWVANQVLIVLGIHFCPRMAEDRRVDEHRDPLHVKEIIMENMAEVGAIIRTSFITKLIDASLGTSLERRRQPSLYQGMGNSSQNLDIIKAVVFREVLDSIVTTKNRIVIRAGTPSAYLRHVYVGKFSEEGPITIHDDTETPVGGLIGHQWKDRKGQFLYNKHTNMYLPIERKETYGSYYLSQLRAPISQPTPHVISFGMHNPREYVA